jgi:uncharacterized protein YggU (UPF0235/DUF167 family)
VSAPPAGPFYRLRDDGADVFVRLTPRSSADEIGGTMMTPDGKRCLLARVRAVPEKGLANRALTRLVADRFRLPSSAVAIASGDTARLKMVRIIADPKAIEALLLTCAASKPA